MKHSEFKHLEKIETHSHSVDGIDYEIDVYREKLIDGHLGDFKILISSQGNGVGSTYETTAETVFDAQQVLSTPQNIVIDEMLKIIMDDIDRNLEGQFR